MTDMWTTKNIPDQQGKVMIVTGGNSGIGYETVLALAARGAEVIMASRNPDKARDAIRSIKDQQPGAALQYLQLELSSLDSIRDFAAQFQTRYSRLDALINNAGIMLVPHQLTEDGFESTFGVNHLGHFALTGLLLDQITATPGSRVVNVSSNAHYAGVMNFGNLMPDPESGYSSRDAYGQSKLANLLFTYELQRRFNNHGTDALSIAAHPGISNTALADHLFKPFFLRPLRPLMGVFFQSAARGALPTLRAAVDPDVVGGEYYGPDGKGERSGYPVRVDSTDASKDLEAAQKLWDISQELTGVSYLN